MIISNKAKKEEERNALRRFVSENNNNVLGRERDISVSIYDGEALDNYFLGTTFGASVLVLNIAEVNILKSKLKKSTMKSASGLVEFGKVDSSGAYIEHPKRFWYT